MGETARQILIIESDGEQIQLLEEAFAEMSEIHFAGGFAPHCEREYALSRIDAEALLSQYKFDAILWDIAVREDGADLPAYWALHSLAPESPVILLVDRGDEARALSLIRNGVQDYLLRDEIDCLPLARVLRTSMERERVFQAWRACSLSDDLTGLYNRRGFLDAAGRDSGLACRVQLPFTVSLIDCAGERGELSLIEAAAALREAIPSEVIIGRWSAHQLAIAGLDGSAAGAVTFAEERNWPIGTVTVCHAARPEQLVIADVIAAAEQALCQNKQVENCA
jgi:PleD family two-component response regulator